MRRGTTHYAHYSIYCLKGLWTGAVGSNVREGEGKRGEKKRRETEMDDQVVLTIN